MRRPRVKICGLTRLADAELAVQLGADALGFVLWEGSPRYVDGGSGCRDRKANAGLRVASGRGGQPAAKRG